MDNLRFDIEWNANEDDLRRSMAESRKAVEGVGQTFDDLEKHAGNMVSHIEAQMNKIDLAKGFVAKSTAIKDAFGELEGIMSDQLQKISNKLLSGDEILELSAVLHTVEGDFERIQLVVGTLALKLKDMPGLELGERTEMYASLEAIANFTSKLNDLQSKVPLTSAEVKKLKDAMVELELQGKANSEEYHTLKQAATELQTAIANTNTTVKEATSPTPYIDQAVRGIQSLIAGYNVLQGVTALFGSENEDLQKGILKITAAMSILQGLQQIQLELRKKDNILITSQTLLQRGYAIAVGQSTGALRLFRLALLGTGIGLAVVGIGLLIEYMSKLREQQQKAAERQKVLNEAMESSKSAISTASGQISVMHLTIKEAQAGLRSKTGALKEYNEGLGRTMGQANNLNEAERLIIKNADRYIEVTYAKARAMAVAELAAKKYAEIVQLQIKDASEFIPHINSPHLSESSKSFERGRAERIRGSMESELRKEYDSYLRIGTNLEKEYLQKLKASGLSYRDAPSKPKSAGSAESALNSIIGSRENVEQRVAEIRKEYARKMMESDESEIQAVKDKFAKINQVIITENEKITRYNLKNKNKKGFKPVDLIDTAQLKPIEQMAIQEVTYSQQTKKIAADLEEAKKLFADYEEYKSKFGKEKADEHFKVDLKGFENYFQYVTALSEKEAEAHAAVATKTATTGQEERSKLLSKEADEAKRVEEKKYTDLLALMITYDQRRKVLIATFEAERAKVVSEATVEELREFDRKHVEELNQLDDSNIQQLASYKTLFEGIQNLSDAAARKVISDAKSMVATNKNMSADERKKIEKAIKESEKALKDRLPDRINALSQDFATMAGEIGNVNAGLGDMLSLVSKVLRSTAQVGENITALKKGFDNYGESKKQGGGGILGSISAIAGVAGPIGSMVSAVTSVVSGVVGIFNAAKESARKAKEEMRKYQEEVLQGELEYNRILRERARSHSDINEMSLKELETQKQLLEAQLKLKQVREITSYKENPSMIDLITGRNKTKQTEMLSDYEYMLKRIQAEGQQIIGQKTEKYGGFLGIGKKTRVVDITADLAGKTYDDLEKLYTEGKLTESTKALFENLKKAKEEVDDINDLMKEIEETIKDKMSGNVTASSLAGGIIQGFKEGKRAAVDFADSMEEVVQNALLSAMSTTILEEPLMELVRKFREDAKDGLNAEEIEAFKKTYAEIVQSGLDAVKDIEKLTGKTIGADSGSISGRINRATTEETSSAILGFERARYDLAKQQLNAVLATLDFDEKSYDQILEQVRYLKAIAQNTQDTVTELKNAVIELKSINKNTSVQSNRAYTG
ncbi:hypothetical protein [Sphingobacterium psychroaquaticum]|uniref:Uncharacterized protein n=1 Tax=Sphingobacterium psychroaquaticum TaxID=561061 RepID=A0A1X7K328_9SPHI|nr:hypothetical protein [Sphingobacterium psychroaquaticum]SMG35369.1 hypothetical protein SAMN05660862_2517 [Sphingobacterium psychroaquaticum]